MTRKFSQCRSKKDLHYHHSFHVPNGEKGSDNLMLTHGLNGIRNTAVNKIMEVVGGRKDYKVDCIASEFKDWEVSWDVPRNKKYKYTKIN